MVTQSILRKFNSKCTVEIFPFKSLFHRLKENLLEKKTFCTKMTTYLVLFSVKSMPATSHFKMFKIVKKKVIFKVSCADSSKDFTCMFTFLAHLAIGYELWSSFNISDPLTAEPNVLKLDLKHLKFYINEVYICPSQSTNVSYQQAVLVSDWLNL